MVYLIAHMISVTIWLHLHHHLLLLLQLLSTR
jgi:hypothetical protein